MTDDDKETRMPFQPLTLTGTVATLVVPASRAARPAGRGSPTTGGCARSGKPSRSA